MKTCVWIMCVRLVAGDAFNSFPVRSCDEGVPWLRKAFAWAERSHLPTINGPMYVCSWEEKKS